MTIFAPNENLNHHVLAIRQALWILRQTPGRDGVIRNPSKGIWGVKPADALAVIRQHWPLRHS